jgi:repressor LexA
MQPLTEKQRKVFEFIERRLLDSDPPTQRQIARHFGIAQNAAYQLVGYLKRKGYLEKTSGHRGLRLSGAYLELKKKTQGLPVVGKVAAGEPILARENVEGYADLGKFFRASEGCFVLKVAGDSMIDEGIMDGDYVVVEPSPGIENGRIGVVLLDDEATVKRVYVRKDGITLKPANRAAGYRTEYVRRGDKNVRIAGRVTGCLRLL